ncbi:MAG: hypothetical protein R2939_02035 [Kofleriaceae bacterium]
MQAFARSASFVLGASLVACGGTPAQPQGPGNTGTAARGDLLAVDAAGWRAVVERGGAPYLALRIIEFTDPVELDPSLTLPACWNTGGIDAFDGPACTMPVPAGSPLLAEVAALPATLTVITETGTCTATVGAPVALDSHGCEPSTMIVAPLTGCAGPLARVGHTGALDGELRWLPAQVVEEAEYADDAAAIRDPLHRAQLTTWIAAEPLAGATLRGARTLRASVDAGNERFESILAGYLIGDDDADECTWETGRLELVGLRHGDELTPVAVEADWDGVLAWRGNVVGVVTGGDRDVELHDLSVPGEDGKRFAQTVWWDNEECTQGGWAYLEYPCGP